jgi:regulator of sirC expression with transglutaminase-like and TPR domain
MTDKNPDFSPIRMRARGFVSQGRIEDALGLYGDILKIAPEDAATYADRGTTFAMIKKTDLALSDLNRAIELGYTDPSAYCTLATIFLEGGGYQKSLDYFDKALKLNPDQPFVYFNRARVYETLGDIKAAIADLERCLTYNPDDALSAKIKERVTQLRARM